MKIITILLLLFSLSCTSSKPDRGGSVVWDVVEIVNVKGVLDLESWGTSVILESPEWGVMLTPRNKPVPSGNEGCMCVYLAEPPNLAWAIAQVFKTAPVTRAQLKESELRELEQKIHPTVYLSVVDRGPDAQLTVLVKLKEKELAKWQGRISKSLLYHREEYANMKGRKDVGFFGLMSRFVRQALTFQDGPDDSEVFLSILNFLETVAETGAAS